MPPVQIEQCSLCGKDLRPSDDTFLHEGNVLCGGCYSIANAASVPIQADLGASMETCGNCGRRIGKLETPCTFRNNVVCAECHAVLSRRQQEPTRPAGTPNRSKINPLTVLLIFGLLLWFGPVILAFSSNSPAEVHAGMVQIEWLGAVLVIVSIVARVIIAAVRMKP